MNFAGLDKLCYLNKRHISEITFPSFSMQATQHYIDNPVGTLKTKRVVCKSNIANRGQVMW